MAQIASEDYVNKLIYLHVDTVTNGFSPKLMQQEHRTLRRLNANDERNFDPMVTFTGNEAKGGGKFTPPSTRLRAGVRVVPYDSAHSLSILDEILNVPDGLANVSVFDRSGVTANVDIDVGFNPVEVVQVTSGSGVTQQDKDDIVNQMYARQIDGSMNFEMVSRLMAAVVYGNIEEDDDGNYIIYNMSGSKERIKGHRGPNGGRVRDSVDAS